MIRPIIFVLLACSASLFSCKKDNTPPTANPVITPGIGITGLSIGDATQKAIDQYGQGSKSYGESGGQYQHFVSFLDKGVTVYCETTTQATFDPALKIKKFLLDSPYTGKTDKSIGIGSLKTEVVTAYGQPNSSSINFGDQYNIGITFIYDSNGTKVEQIEVAKY